ncbi:MAG: peptidoglycan editing factor PgeF [Bacteroidaceae bacterium]
MSSLIIYNTPGWLTAFSTGKDCGLEDMGLRVQDLSLPRQTHSDHILKVMQSGRPEDTDAVITSQPGLCVCVKTADCIPVLLYDDKEHQVAAVHAGWRGTVAGIAAKTANLMTSQPRHMHAIIGPGISMPQFEVGDEVYETFQQADFPMNLISRKLPSIHGGERWHIDLWEANRWQLQEAGVEDVFVQGICTMTSPHYYSARRETINTGRNMNGILINL